MNKPMPKAVIAYVGFVDEISRIVGRFAMYMIFAMLGVLLYSSIMKTFFLPALWTLEMAQFLMAAYYILGGAYSMQLGGHVRMDLLYSTWSSKQKGFSDTITSLALIFYLVLLMYGGISSSLYAAEYGEKSYSSWAPYMAPIKIIMTFGVFLMLLQAIATFFKDLARSRGYTVKGRPIGEHEHVEESVV